MSVTDEELEEKRQRIYQLREEIAQAEQEKADAVHEANNEVEFKLLESEEARLSRELAAVKGVPLAWEAPTETPATLPSAPLISGSNPFGTSQSDFNDDGNEPSDTDEE